MKKIGTKRRLRLTLITVCSILSISLSAAVSAYADQGTEVTARIETAGNSAADNSSSGNSGDSNAGNNAADSTAANSPTGAASGTDKAADNSGSPNTGDSADLLLCGAFLLIIGLGAAGTKVYAKVKK